LKAVDSLWAYTGELFEPETYESISGIDFSTLKEKWLQKVKEVFEEATIPFPDGEDRDGAVYQHSGGKNGIHTEHMGYILSDLQYLQRTYPGAEW
jgi:ring-1,2-phenylacetyl-CoA epoxidase subunit PaaC